MKLACSVLSFILFSLLFVVIVLPLGWLQRLALDPLRLRRRQTDSFFNLIPQRAGSTGRPADASLPLKQRPNPGARA